MAILPIRIEDILPARALEYFIGNVHWLDALTPPLESHIQNLAGTVKILLGRLPQHGVAPIPHAEQAAKFPQSDPVPKGPKIPQPPTAESVAPEKFSWAQPVSPPAPQQIPMERVPETSSWTPPKETFSPPVPPATSAVQKQKRAIGLVVIAIVVFLASAVAIIGTLHDSIQERSDALAGFGLLFGATGIAASYGVITKNVGGVSSS